MLFVAATLTLGACSEKDNEKQKLTPENIVGTEWVSNVSNTYSILGFSANIAIDFTMKFNDAKRCVLFMSMSLDVPSMPNMSNSRENQEEFDYIFDGAKLSIIENGTTRYELTYNEGDNTFTMLIPEIEEIATWGLSVEQVLGTNQVVFRKK